MSYMQLSEEDRNYIDSLRDSNGLPYSDSKKDEMAGIILRRKFIETDGKPLFKFEPEKPKPIKPSPVEQAIYGNNSFVQRQVRDLQEDLQAQGVQIQQPETQIDLSQYQTRDLFVLSYDDFGRELIRRANNRFRNTKAEIPTRGLRPNQEIPRGNILVRAAYLTTIIEDEELRNLSVFPITPLESETLLEVGRLPKDPRTYWEDLGLILYDISGKGVNSQEAKALKESLEHYKEELGLRNGDLEKRLLIVNAGLEADSTFPKGVKFKVLPGITKAYKNKVLEKTGKNPNFSYGSDNGLPSTEQLGKGSRTLWMPDSNSDLGLRVLYRNGDSVLCAGDEYLDNSYGNDRVSFAKKFP